MSSSPAGGANGMNQPYGIASDGTRLVVVDSNNHRVLIWNQIPTAVDQGADLVLGQASMSGTSPNRGASTAQNSLKNPTGVAIYGDKLLVADMFNNRVLVWNSFPTVNGQNADVVIGQASFATASAPAASSTSMNQPTHLTVSSSGELYVVDNMNNRVLYYPSIPSTSGAAALFALGQLSLSAGTSATAQNGLKVPLGISINGSTLAVADKGNHRVLFYNVPPGFSGIAARAVLGQADFVSATTACNATSLNVPYEVYLKSNGAVYVADQGNNRILYWPDASTLSNGQAASQVFGQSSMNTCGSNAGGISQLSLNLPTAVYSDSNGYLWSVDQGNSRVTVNPWY